MPETVELANIGQYVLVAVLSFIAATVGGITGYGTGLILPPVLLPIVGAEAVVPIISLSALITNASRLAAFREKFNIVQAKVVAAYALPTCILGAYAYTAMSGSGITFVIGLALVALVPLRRIAQRVKWTLTRRGVAAAGTGYGLLVGATSGSGVVLLSILMAAGLQGSAVVATDAGISLLLGIVKTLVFQSTGALGVSSWTMALLIGVCATPGAFLAKRVAGSLPMRVHANILDGVVMLAGLMLIVQSLR